MQSVGKCTALIDNRKGSQNIEVKYVEDRMD